MKKLVPFVGAFLVLSNLAFADPVATSSPAYQSGPAATSSPAYQDPQPQDGDQANADNPPSPDTFSADDIAKSMKDLGASANALGSAMAKGIASAIAKFGQPTGIIVGSEFQGSLIVGYRKGNGMLLFKGQDPSAAMKIYWEAPSIGFGAGFTASDICILVYNTNDETKLLGSYGSAEGSAHWVAGGSISYLNNLSSHSENQISLAHIGVGIGFDLTARLEALTFSDHSKLLPF